MIRLLSEFFRQFVQPSVNAILLDVVETLAVDPWHAAVSPTALIGEAQNITAINLVVEGVKPIVWRVLRFGVQRRL